MLLLGSYTINILGQKFCSPWNLFRIADLHFVWFFQNLFTIRVSSTELKVCRAIFWSFQSEIVKLTLKMYIDPTRLFWVYMIILNSNKGNLHDYSESTIIRNGRVSGPL